MDINVKNVSALIHFMDGLNDPLFDMSQFVHSCGTPSCALGWACAVPELNAAGMPKKMVGRSALFSADRVFGKEAYWHLFNGTRNSRIKTPQQWADHARAVLHKMGHEVTPKTPVQADNFRQFMDRVLAPRPELQALAHERQPD